MSGVSFQDVAAVACKLPEVEISKSTGAPSLTVRGKMLARLLEDGQTLVVRTGLPEREILMQADPDTYFITGQYTNYPLVLVRLGRVSHVAVPDLIERAWRLVAPAALIRQFDTK
jgi:hypothetical protein